MHIIQKIRKKSLLFYFLNMQHLQIAMLKLEKLPIKMSQQTFFQQELKKGKT